MMTILFSLGSMFFAGVNDLVFKRYGQKPRSVGAFIALIGIVWTLFFLTLGFIKGTLSWTLPLMIIGSLTGITSAISNILLIEAMKRTGAGIGSTIYRLNLIFVAVMAFFFLHETFNIWKTTGLVCAVVTIVLIFQNHNEPSGQSPAVRFLLLLVLASFLRACMGIGYKIASLCQVSDEAFLALNGVYWMIFGGAYLLSKERSVVLKKKVLVYAALSGLLVCGIAICMKWAVNYGDASVAVTISQLSFLITVPGSVILFHEHCSLKTIAAVFLAVAGIILLAIGQV
ncbi:MAG: DMT family transporter [Verrucomicrobia bacterium]|nr:DMT family transporter [Verrucomicrobiota bacterium]MCG2680992.1 DMT family transporter [Kiritimatiellia bacterium]MBU4247772.1 DMT family transporter [Verrucomicrobiota bacterium]MBU4292060.1 DMT family transporter [Verrucomicrobiota bacterium]MBU4429985.1 DMT family transporter [Verrucomicrobiota bacterium]